MELWCGRLLYEGLEVWRVTVWVAVWGVAVCGPVGVAVCGSWVWDSCCLFGVTVITKP